MASEASKKIVGFAIIISSNVHVMFQAQARLWILIKAGNVTIRDSPSLLIPYLQGMYAGCVNPF